MADPQKGVRPGTADDIDELAELAALTFPLAAPPHVTAESLATFIDQHLSASRLQDYLADPTRQLTIATSPTGRLIGYTLLVFAQPQDPDVAAIVQFESAVEVSKVYAHPAEHGSGVARALMDDVIARASERGATGMWLGVNQENVRAQRFYAKCGFTRVGTKRFQVGAGLEHDFVYALDLSDVAVESI